MHRIFPVHPHFKVRLGEDEITFVIHMVELLHIVRLLYVGYYEPEDDGSIGNAARPTSPAMARAAKHVFGLGISEMTGKKPRKLNRIGLWSDAKL
jgi:hypothetical protein